MKKIKSKLKTKAKPKKKLKAKVKKPTLKIKKIEGKLVGKVSHYFDHINVVVIKLSAPLNQGDEVRIIGGKTTDFNQNVKSIQIDHKEIKKAKKGNSVGMMVKEKVREGDKIYKV